MAIQSTPFQSTIDPGMRAASLARTSDPDRLPDKAQTNAVVVRDPAAMMADMAEELGFLNAERTGGADEAEEEQDAAFDDLIDELIRKSMQAAQKAAPAGMKDDAQALRNQLIQSGTSARSGQGLEAALRRYTGGSSQQALALMAELSEMAKSDPELQRLGFGAQAVADYALAHEAGLTAALNIAEVLAAAGGTVPDSAQRMLGMPRA